MLPSPSQPLRYRRYDNIHFAEKQAVNTNYNITLAPISSQITTDESNPYKSSLIGI